MFLEHSLVFVIFKPPLTAKLLTFFQKFQTAVCTLRVNETKITTENAVNRVPGISGNSVVKSKLPPQSGTSLEAVEPHP